MSPLFDPAVLIPLLSAAVLLLGLSRAILHILFGVVGLFSRNRLRRADARRLLEIVTKAPQDRPPQDGDGPGGGSTA
ncbi:hypothetical protein [Actinoplanes sp. NPDC026670]|uniref:hypothetical protein n=1 Tax=Actinoplanes sp. NPDC026670 TaxID=3154700 RepID=UPI0033E4FF33